MKAVKTNYFWKWTLLLLAIWVGSEGCKKDPCKDVECLNGGACLEGVCECPQGFVGDRCESLDVSGYLGTYRVEYEGCFDTSPAHVVGVAEATENGYSIQFLDLGDYQCPGASRIRVNAKVSATGIEIPEQVVCANADFEGYRYTGEGAKDADTIRLSFSVVYQADGQSRLDSCKAVMVKQ